MLATKDRSHLRVTILGHQLDPDELRAALPHSAVQVDHAADVSELLRSAPDVGLIAIDVSELAGIAAALSTEADVAPLMVLVGSDERPNPQLSLIFALVQAKREWEGAFDALTDPVAILARDGRVRRANLSFAEALGRSIVGAVGRPYLELLGEPLEGFADSVAASLADGRPRTEEVQFAILQGLRQVTTAPLSEGANGAGGLVVVLKDVSRLKEQQQQLTRASRLADIGLLSAGVAHEINTPLASVALRAESLIKRAKDPRLLAIDSFREFPRYLETINAQIFRCKKIIAALLDFSRSRRHEMRPTDLNLLAEKAADLLGHQMRINQVSLALELEPALPSIAADEGQLSQALVVLMMNALDATPPHGNVRLETARIDDWRVRLTVADDGAGIPSEHLAKIFNPFFTTKPPGKGTGLGLAICHGVVTSHGGEIEVDSEQNRGSRFSMILPVRGPAHGSSPYAP